MKTRFVQVRLSFEDLLGTDYAEAVIAARAILSGERIAALRPIARRKIDFYPVALQRRVVSLLPRVGDRVAAPFRGAAGATTKEFAAHTKRGAAPVGGLGPFRVGEDGRLYLISKSEHYHAPLGHAFPGYGLIDVARRLGVPNPTHNNTRGHITRLLEELLVAAANGLEPEDGAAVVANRGNRGLLNRVLNLETGSLVAEAALKMMLARFGRVQPGFSRPPMAGKTPVFLVIGSDAGGLDANYHGTTVIAQMLRGMWPDLARRASRGQVLKIHAIRPNHLGDLEDAFRKFARGQDRIAGFLHEIVMMNYGAVRLRRSFLRRAYALCRRHGVPTLVDEIQSCAWSPELFLFREYRLRPSLVAVGKGFPGGEYPASRLLFNHSLDCLPQFGALVTNGQEELAALAYLVTMRWARANAEATAAVGDYYERRLRALCKESGGRIREVAGLRHMSALVFGEVGEAKRCAAELVKRGLDVSVQTYKSDCPPVCLTKLPLIAGYEVVDAVVDRMRAALAR